MESKTMLKTKDLATRFNVTEGTILNYVKQGKITPFNKESWHFDGEYLYWEEDINFDSLLNKKPGLTISEVAATLGVSYTTVTKYIKTEVIASEKHIYKGRKISFIAEDEVEKLSSSRSIVKKHNKRVYYHSSSHGNFILYQPFKHNETGNLARIVHIDEDFKKIKALTYDDKVVTLSDLTKSGYQSLYDLKEGKYKTRRGYAIFRFIKPAHLNSIIFKVLDLFYKTAGPRNIRLFEEGEYIKVELKPIIIKLNANWLSEYEGLLRNTLVEGKVVSTDDGLIIDSDIEGIQLHLSSELKKSIVKTAKEKGLSTEEYLLTIIKEHHQ